mmetsp:Transcript_53383/g.169709  ORF Transcript_53383/g.169709 Transcript_53383/m.169709 type:complete len:313 (-) Transcript_53383:2837-3775(-)
MWREFDNALEARFEDLGTSPFSLSSLDRPWEYVSPTAPSPSRSLPANSGKSVRRYSGEPSIQPAGVKASERVSLVHARSRHSRSKMIVFSKRPQICMQWSSSCCFLLERRSLSEVPRLVSSSLTMVSKSMPRLRYILILEHAVLHILRRWKRRLRPSTCMHVEAARSHSLISLRRSWLRFLNARRVEDSSVRAFLAASLTCSGSKTPTTAQSLCGARKAQSWCTVLPVLPPTTRRVRLDPGGGGSSLCTAWKKSPVSRRTSPAGPTPRTAPCSTMPRSSQAFLDVLKSSSPPPSTTLPSTISAREERSSPER